MEGKKNSWVSGVLSAGLLCLLFQPDSVSSLSLLKTSKNAQRLGVTPPQPPHKGEDKDPPSPTLEVLPLRENRDGNLPNLAEAVEDAERCLFEGKSFVPSLSDSQMADLHLSQVKDAAEEQKGVREAKEAEKVIASNGETKGTVAKTLKRWKAWIEGKWAKVKSFKFSTVRAYLSRKYKLWGVARSRDKLAGVLKKFEWTDPTAKCFRTLRHFPQVKETEFDLLTFCKLVTDQACGQAFLHGDGASLENDYTERNSRRGKSQKETAETEPRTISQAITDDRFARPRNETSAAARQEFVKAHKDAAADRYSGRTFARDQYDAFHIKKGQEPPQVYSEKENMQYAAIRACHHMLIHRTFVPMDKLVNELVWKKRKNLLGITLKFIIIAGSAAASILVPPAIGLGVIAAAGLGTAFALGSFGLQNAVDLATGQENAFTVGRLKSWTKLQAGVIVLSIAASPTGIPAVPILRTALGIKNANEQMGKFWKEEKEIQDLFEAAIFPDRVREGNETLAGWTERTDSMLSSSDSDLTGVGSPLKIETPEGPLTPRAECPIFQSSQPKAQTKKRWSETLEVANVKCKKQKRSLSGSSLSLGSPLSPPLHSSGQEPTTPMTDPLADFTFEPAPEAPPRKRPDLSGVYPAPVWTIQRDAEGIRRAATQRHTTMPPLQESTEEEEGEEETGAHMPIAPSDSVDPLSLSCELDETAVELVEEQNGWGKGPPPCGDLPPTQDQRPAPKSQAIIPEMPKGDMGPSVDQPRMMEESPRLFDKCLEEEEAEMERENIRDPQRLIKETLAASVQIGETVSI